MFPDNRHQPPRRWDDVAKVLGLAFIALTILAGAAAAGYLVGLRHGEASRAEFERTRRAFCLLLDELGADPETGPEAEPCRPDAG